MNPSEDELAGRIIQHLNYGAERLDPRTRTRLLAAREFALSRSREARVPVLGFGWAGHPVVRIGGHRVDIRYLIVTVVLVALAGGLIGLGYWKKVTSRVNELAEIDARILADDLPINAYLDRGFDAWLRRSSH